MRSSTDALALSVALLASLSLVGYGIGELGIWVLFFQQLIFILAGLLGLKSSRLFSFDYRNFFLGLTCGVGIFLLNALLGSLSLGAIGQILGEEVVETLIQAEIVRGERWFGALEPSFLWISGCFLILGAPLAEELFFRGLVFKVVEERFPSSAALLFSALVFALAHFSLLHLVPLFASGLLLGKLFLLRRNLWVPIVAHATANALVFFSAGLIA